jgi:hypothetical protein
MTFRHLAIAALFSVPAVRPAAAALDAPTQARLAADREAIRQADASRRTVLLTRTTDAGERQRALYEYRDQRRKAVLDASEALLAVRGTVPKEEWKAIVEEIGAGGMPFLAAEAQKQLPEVVSDPARRASADKVLADLSAAIKKRGADPNSARRKFLTLLEKKSSTQDDFISALEKVTEAQEKLDDKVLDATSALQRTLTPEEWDELVRRLAVPGGAPAK